MKKWILEDAKQSDVAYRIYMDDTDITEHVCEVYRTTDEMQDKKNAELIANVPRMLRALTAIAQYSDSGNELTTISHLKHIASNALKIPVSQSNK